MTSNTLNENCGKYVRSERRNNVRVFYDFVRGEIYTRWSGRYV